VGVRAVLGVDGGNSKTDLVVASLDGELLAHVRGPGSNSHAVGAEGCADVIGALVEQAGVGRVYERGAFFLCGADVPADVDELEEAVRRRGWVRYATVDNDTFALLRAGSGAPAAVAVVCGSGINCVGRAPGRIVRYPGLGWETGDWGGGEGVGREALFLAVRGEDGRGEPTALTKLVRRHFALPTAVAVGEAVHYRRLSPTRLGELAPGVVAAAAAGDAVAHGLVERLADEVSLLATRALADLGVARADVVLGGGMLCPGKGPLHDAVVERLRRRAPAARPVVAADPPVLGAALVALDEAGAPPGAGARLRAELRARLAEERAWPARTS
jgi:N-acetylglucosamine kinase-like BadF-type ATPase